MKILEKFIKAEFFDNDKNKLKIELKKDVLEIKLNNQSFYFDKSELSEFISSLRDAYKSIEF
jgi:hypothetical protein